MYCFRCGAKNELVEAKFCYSCGTELILPANENDDSKIADASNMEISNTNMHLVNLDGRYVGFWRRFVASFGDNLVVGIPLKLINYLFANNPPSVLGFLALAELVAIWLYYTMMESSGYQGTLGKISARIKVIGYDGKRISFARANARLFSKILSYCTLLIGYIMVAFNRKHQALHDIIAKTYVIDANDVPKSIRNRGIGNAELRGKSFNMKD